MAAGALGWSSSNLLSIVAGVLLTGRWVQQNPVGVAAWAQIDRVVEQAGGEDAGDDGQVRAGLQQDGDGHAGQRHQGMR